jgi:phosphorylated CTD-interacting factor 1
VVPGIAAAVRVVSSTTGAAARMAGAELDTLADALAGEATAGWRGAAVVAAAVVDQGGCPMLQLRLQVAAPPGAAEARGPLAGLAGCVARQPLVHTIHAEHADRLRAAHRAAGGGGSFEAAAWRLLHRYEALFGPGGGGGGWQLATPPAAMAVLRDRLGVGCEGFASPLNRSALLPAYCSAFPDTDACFGSRGSFFGQAFPPGSYQVGPPYDEQLMQRAVDHVHTALATAAPGKAMSFAFIVPDWPVSAALDSLRRSPYLRRAASLAKDGHRYVNGLQHRCKPKHRLVTYEGSTYVAVLQTDAGATRWPATVEVLQQLCAAWAPGAAAGEAGAPLGKRLRVGET